MGIFLAPENRNFARYMASAKKEDIERKICQENQNPCQVRESLATETDLRICMAPRSQKALPVSRSLPSKTITEMVSAWHQLPRKPHKVSGLLPSRTDTEGQNCLVLETRNSHQEFGLLPSKQN